MNSRRQPQRIPPPIDSGAEILDSGAILDEIEGDLALVLWKSVRAVRLWARQAPELRAELFAPRAFRRRMDMLEGIDGEKALVKELRVVAGVVRKEAADAAAIAAACGRIAEWAESRGALATAIEFAQAAAFADPTQAGLARSVGVLARRRCDYGRAETWFRQAIYTARRTRNWPIFVRSFLGLSNVHLLRGNYPAARKAALRALHAARRRGNSELVGMAYHDLLGLAFRTDRAGEAARYGRAALEAYGAGHPRLPALAHDIAVSWMKRGYFAEALRVFSALDPGYGTPLDQLMSATARVRAGGAVGDRDVYTTGILDAERLLRAGGVDQGVSTAFLDMARGAKSIGDLERAREYADRARQWADEHAEHETLFAAEGLLQAAGRPPEIADPAAPARKTPRQLVSLARDLAAALAT